LISWSFRSSAALSGAMRFCAIKIRNSSFV
jgi:hypothetical protein